MLATQLEGKHRYSSLPQEEQIVMERAREEWTGIAK